MRPRPLAVAAVVPKARFQHDCGPAGRPFSERL